MADQIGRPPTDAEGRDAARSDYNHDLTTIVAEMEGQPPEKIVQALADRGYIDQPSFLQTGAGDYKNPTYLAGILYSLRDLVDDESLISAIDEAVIALDPPKATEPVGMGTVPEMTVGEEDRKEWDAKYPKIAAAIAAGAAVAGTAAAAYYYGDHAVPDGLRDSGKAVEQPKSARRGTLPQRTSASPRLEDSPGPQIVNGGPPRPVWPKHEVPPDEQPWPIDSKKFPPSTKRAPPQALRDPPPSIKDRLSSGASTAARILGPILLGYGAGSEFSGFKENQLLALSTLDAALKNVAAPRPREGLTLPEKEEAAIDRAIEKTTPRPAPPDPEKTPGGMAPGRSEADEDRLDATLKKLGSDIEPIPAAKMPPGGMSLEEKERMATRRAMAGSDTAPAHLGPKVREMWASLSPEEREAQLREAAR